MKIAKSATSLWAGHPPTEGWRIDGRLVSMTITELGAHLVDVTLHEANGDTVISVGYPGDAPVGAHGATVGRYANRIADARFDLDGSPVELAPNEGPNQLHGGPHGFDRCTWQGDAEHAGSIARVELHLVSPAGDQGYPGRLRATAIFELEDDRLQIEYRAESDAPTPVNLTNHTYWNLGGPGALDGHQLAVAADRYVEVDADLLPIDGPPRDVAGTPFDCRRPRPLDDIVEAGGYDHCFVLTAARRPHVELTHVSGRRLAVTTDQVGMQVYTGRHLPAHNAGIAFEPQLLPDTPNRPDFGDAILRPGERYRSTTQLAFGAAP